MKNQKQLLIGVIALAILIPQITFAAWWNPFTWKIFNRPLKIDSVVELPKEETNDNVVDQSAEIEKLKKEVEELKRKSTVNPTQQKSQAQVVPQKEDASLQPANIKLPTTENPPIDSSLKIARCQAESKSQGNTLKQLYYKRAEDGFGKNISDAEEGLRKSKLEQINRSSQYYPDLSPEQNRSIASSTRAAIQPTIDYYESMRQKNLKLLQDSKIEIDRAIDQIINELYLKCLNK